MSQHNDTPDRGDLRNPHAHPARHHDADAGLPDLLDLDAEVIADQLRAVRDDVERLSDAPVRRILDLGAGTGTGTLGLLQHFPAAHAVALDSSPQMLDGLSRRAEHRGLSDRVTVLCTDLDHGLPSLEPVDLAWASASLHHLADPDRTLPEVVGAIRPGGLLAVLEIAGHPRFLPDDTPAGTAEARAHEILAADRAADMPAMGSNWGPRLTHAGLVIETDHTIDIDLVAPLASVVGDYGAAILTRILGAVAARLDTTDRKALEALLAGGPEDIRRRADLHVRSQRQLWIARRPFAGKP